MIRKVVGARAATTHRGRRERSRSGGLLRDVSTLPGPASATLWHRHRVDREESAPTTPTAPFCHGTCHRAPSSRGIMISIIEEQRGKQPLDLTDDQSYSWSRPNGDVVFAVIKRGVLLTMTPGSMDSVRNIIIWRIVNDLAPSGKK